MFVHRLPSMQSLGVGVDVKSCGGDQVIVLFLNISVVRAIHVFPAKPTVALVKFVMYLRGNSEMEQKTGKGEHFEFFRVKLLPRRFFAGRKSIIRRYPV
jgi:hypothetical protein